MHTVSSFYPSKTLSPLRNTEKPTITYRKKPKLKLAVIKHQRNNLNFDLPVARTASDLKIQINKIPERILKSKDLFIETCDSTAFKMANSGRFKLDSLYSFNSLNKTSSNFKSPKNLLHEKFIELDYNTESAKIVDKRKQKLNNFFKSDNFSNKNSPKQPKFKNRSEMEITDMLDEYIEFLKSPENKFKQTATYLVVNQIKEAPKGDLIISRNKFITKIINNVVRKVRYLNKKNIKMSEELAMNLINDEINELTNNIDKDVETSFKIKNFSSVLKEGNSVTIIPIINSISRKIKSSSSPKNLFTKAVDRDKQIIDLENLKKTKVLELSLIDEKNDDLEKEESINANEVGGVSRNKNSYRFKNGITEDPTKINSDTKFIINTENGEFYKSISNNTEEDKVAETVKKHHKLDNITNSAILNKIKNSVSVSQKSGNMNNSNSRNMSQATDKKERPSIDGLIIKNMGIESSLLPEALIESYRLKKKMTLFQPRDTKNKIKEFDLNEGNQNNDENYTDKYTVLSRSSKPDLKYSKTIINKIVIKFEEEKVVTIEKLNISDSEGNDSSNVLDETRGLRKYTSTSFKSNVSNLLKSNNNSPHKEHNNPIEDVKALTTGFKEEGSNSKPSKKFQRMETYKRIVNFDIQGNKVKKVGGWKNGNGDNINDTESYDNELDEDYASCLNLKSESSGQLNVNEIEPMDNNKINGDEIPTTVKSKTMAFKLDQNHLKSILNKRGSFFNNNTTAEKAKASSTTSKQGSLFSTKESNFVSPGGNNNTSKEPVINKFTDKQQGVISEKPQARVKSQNNLTSKPKINNKGNSSKKKVKPKSNKSSNDKVSINNIDKKDTIDQQPSARIPQIDKENYSIIYEETDNNINDGDGNGTIRSKGMNKYTTNKTIFDLQKNMTGGNNSNNNSNKSLYRVDNRGSSNKTLTSILKSKSTTKVLQMKPQDNSDGDSEIEGDDFYNSQLNTKNNVSRINMTNKSSRRLTGRNSFDDSSIDEYDLTEEQRDELKEELREVDALAANSAEAKENRKVLYMLKKRQSLRRLKETLDMFNIKDPSQLTEKHIEEFVSLSRKDSASNEANEYNHQQLLKLFEKFKEKEKENVEPTQLEMK
jgi:hypothetical protein